MMISPPTQYTISYPLDSAYSTTSVYQFSLSKYSNSGVISFSAVKIIVPVVNYF